MKILAVITTVLTIVFATLYFVETRRTEQLRTVIEQRNRAFVALNSITNRLVNLSSTNSDSLIVEISTSTQVLSNSSTSYIIGTTLENAQHYVWDFDVIEVIPAKVCVLTNLIPISSNYFHELMGTRIVAM